MSESNVRKFLDFLGAAEGAGYNTITGGGSFSSYDKHPGIVGMVTKQGPSTAAGRYQITKTTYDDVAPKLGITDFSPASQDRIAVYLLNRNGSLGDIQSGNFESAIAKNGGTWASLPSSTYADHPKRSSEWVSKYFGGNIKPVSYTPPTLQNQTSAPIEPATSQSAIGMSFQESQNDAKYGGFVQQVKALPEAIGLGFETQNMTYNWLVDRNVQQVDRDFRYTKELVEKATLNVPPEHHGYILQGVSESDLFRRKSRVDEALTKQRELANMGAAGTIGALTGSLLDLPTLVGFIPGLGTASIISKTNRIKNALATGLVMASSNVAADAALSGYKPLATDSDLYWSAAAGLAFGLPIGAMAKTGGKVGGSIFKQEVDDLAKWGQKTASNIQKQEFKDAGVELTEKGKKSLDPEYRAAQVEKAEIEAIRQEAKSIPTMERASQYTDFVPTNSGGKKFAPGSTRDELVALAKSADPAVAGPAARLLEQLADDLPWYNLPKSNAAFKRNSPGVYYQDPHFVAVSKEAKPTTKVHEAAHALTWHKLQYGKANPDTAHGALYKEFDAVYQQALTEAKKQGFSSYYLKNIEEFAAGLYGGSSAKPMIEFLSKIKVEGDSSLLTAFVQTMKKLMGFDDNEMNLFLKSLDISDRLIDEKLMVKTKGTGRASDKEFLSDDPEYADYMPEADPDNVSYTAYGPALENFFARSWVPKEARDIFNKLAGSTTGYKNHAVVQQSAWDQVLALGDGWITKLDKSFKPAFNKYFEEIMEKGEATRWQRAEVFDKWERQVGNYVRGVESDYHPSVIKVGNDIKPLMKEAVDHINNPGKFNGATKRGLTQVEEVDEFGVTTLSDPLPYNENYLPRHPDVAKFNSMTAQFGSDTVQKFFGNAFKAANPKADAKVAERFGKWYFNNLQDSKLNRINDNLENMLRGFDRDSLKESFVKHGNMTEDEATQLLAQMFPKKDKANPLTKNLKSRSSLDETYTEQILMPDGTNHSMSLNDFIDTRTFDVLEAYLRRTAGSISLANQLDVYKAADIERLIKNATEQQFGSALPGDRIAALRENLNFTFDRVLGRPVEQFTVGNKLLEMWRSLNVTRLMGGAVYNQVQELSQIIGAMGWKTTLKAIPELRAMVRDAKTGKVANEMLDQLENLTGGAGADLLRRTDFSPRDDWVRQRGDTALNQWLDRADNALSRSSAGVLKWTGMTGVMIQQKRIQAIAMINHFVEAANGKKLNYSADRLAWMGLDPADTQKVLDGIKSYHSPKQGSRVGSVDFEKWQAADPDSYAKFIVAYQREARRTVQENDLASMVAIMGKGWGQTMFQFMNFPLQAWNKSLMFGMNHGDLQTMSTVLHGGMFAAATYIARTNAQMIGMSAEERADFAEKRLSTKQIVANSVGRIAQVSVLPILIDSTIAPTPIFSGARTTSNVTDFMGSNPTLSAISSALAMPRKIALASASDEVQVSERDVRNWMKLLPFNNVVGISNVLNSVAADFPNSDKQE